MAISIPARTTAREPGGLNDWLDRHSGRLFLMPAVLLILCFSIFPLIISEWLSLSRFRLGAGGYTISWAGLANYKQMLFGSQQFHFVGTFAPIPWQGWLLMAVVFSL
jgi:multiple sugar transport system permease protein